MGMIFTVAFVILLAAVMSICGISLLTFLRKEYLVAKVKYSENPSDLNKSTLRNAKETRLLLGIFGWYLQASAVCLIGGIMTVV